MTLFKQSILDLFGTLHFTKYFLASSSHLYTHNRNFRYAGEDRLYLAHFSDKEHMAKQWHPLLYYYDFYFSCCPTNINIKLLINVV